MRWRDVKESLKEFWREYRRYKTGIAGLILLLIFVGISIFTPLIADEEGYINWRNVEYWEDNPRGVPPEWILLFTPEKLPKHVVLELSLIHI